jgi:hypothetical protein
MLDAFPDQEREDELAQIAENGGRWPAPGVAGASDGQGLSTEQARWLVERFVGHSGRTVSEPAVLSRPLLRQRATYVACSFEVADDVAAVREAPSWAFRALETGHWPMVSAPDELVALLAEVASKHEA